jgi:acetyl-CoA C-acetyltransferase
VLVADRVSNGPTLSWPNSEPEAAAREEHWVRHAFAQDPSTGLSMLHTAETVAQEAGFERADADAVAVLRYEQYRDPQAELVRAQCLVDVDVVDPDGVNAQLSTDEGVRERTALSVSEERPAVAGGVHTAASQTHPADGSAGAIVTTPQHAREMADGGGVVELVAAGFSRVEPGHMPQALVPSAQAALAAAGTSVSAVDAITTHNPFAINDLYFAREMDVALEAMNVTGSSLVFGHPQGPTGLRSIAEMVTVLRHRGGGIGLFAGCAAGDSGASLVVRVDD